MTKIRGMSLLNFKEQYDTTTKQFVGAIFLELHDTL